MHVAEFDEREQKAAGGGPREPGTPADVAECEPRIFAVERADHGQAACERLDEVVAALFGHVQLKRPMKSSAVSATSCHPLSIVSEWPRPAISLNSVTP